VLRKCPAQEAEVLDAARQKYEAEELDGDGDDDRDL
jgi:hypothetical protein